VRYPANTTAGGGSFGKVYKGYECRETPRCVVLTYNRVDKRTGEAVAIKVVEIEGANDDVREIIEEISILAGLHSPYVTRYLGSYLKGSDLWIIMEYCGGGSCADLLESGVLEEAYIAIIVRELLMGLDYLHSDQKLHRDIKGLPFMALYTVHG
jgi:serine/threonine-protein kinase 24/25/MST4